MPDIIAQSAHGVAVDGDRGAQRGDALHRRYAADVGGFTAALGMAGREDLRASRATISDRGPRAA